MRLVALALGLFASIVLARVLGPSGRGEYSFAVYLVAVLAVVGHLSYDAANVHLVATRAASFDRIEAAAFVIPGASALVISLVYAVLLLTLGGQIDGIDAAVILVAGLALPFRVHQQSLISMSQLTYRMRVVNAATLLNSLIQMLTVVALWAFGALTPVTAVASFSGAVFVSWAILAIAMRPPIRAPGRDLARRALRFLSRVHGGTVLTMLTLRIDIFIVAYFLSASEVGIYAAALAIAEVLIYGVEAVSAAALPRQALAAPHAMATLAAQVFRLSVLLLGVSTAVLALISPLLVPLAYGPEFHDAIWVLVALLPGLVAYGCARPLTVYLFCGSTGPLR